MEKKPKESEWYEVAARLLIDHAESSAAKRVMKHTTNRKKGGASAAYEAKQRSSQLSTSADRVGVSFAGAAFQAQYFESKFQRRGMLLKSVLVDLLDTKGNAWWAISSAARGGLKETTVNVASFGGGESPVFAH